MNYRTGGIGGPSFSALGLGSYLTYGDRLDLDASSRCIHAALDHGINFFDTADVYADGEAECVLGRVLSGISKSRWIVGTKCFFPWAGQPTCRGLSRNHLVEAVERSLRNLRVEAIDLLQCHRFDPATPLEETLETLDQLVRDGKVLYWGMGRFDAGQLEATFKLVRSEGWTAPTTHQTIYGLLNREVEDDVLGTAHRQGVGTLVYGALGQGVLTGKYAHGRRPENSRAADKERRETMYHLSSESLEASERFVRLAHRQGATPAQLAIAWCLRRPEIVSVLLGASQPDQIDENVQAVDLELDAGVIEAIESIFKESPAAGD